MIGPQNDFFARLDGLARRLEVVERALSRKPSAESDGNANGTWYMVGDLLICRHILLVTAAANPATWTYPRAFSANPSVTGSVHSNDGHYATIANRTTTQILVHSRAAGGGPSTVDRNVELIAVGAA